eukprot:m.73723 g.73723  ORF g.73723 m.73723 type:complete len:283 (-) comp8039_c0_seq3:213-1061(-)
MAAVTQEAQLQQGQPCTFALPLFREEMHKAWLVAKEGDGPESRITKPRRIKGGTVRFHTLPLHSGRPSRIFVSDYHELQLVVADKDGREVARYPLDQDPVIMTCNRCRRINGPRGREGGNHAPLRLNGLCILCQDSEPCDECGGIGSVQAAVPGRGRTNFCVLCLSEVAEQYPDIRGVYVAGREHRSTMNQERPVGVNMWADDAKEEHEEFWEQEKMPDEHDYLNTCRGCGKFFRYMYFDCDTCSGWDTKRYRICCDCREGGFHTAHHLLVGHTHIYERGQA